jgi:hypothetical protein
LKILAGDLAFLGHKNMNFKLSNTGI